MQNPFDIQSALLARHAQHVVLVHFPIGLFITGVVFDLLAFWTKRRGLADAAYYDLLGAAVSTLPVVVTGILAWQFQLEGQVLKGILKMHLILGCLSSTVIIFVACTHFSTGGENNPFRPIVSPSNWRGWLCYRSPGTLVDF